MGCVLDESSTHEAECGRNMAIRRRAAGTIRPRVNARGLQFECFRVLPILMYCSETMIRKEKERSRIRAVQMGNLKGLVGIRIMDKVPNAWIKEL